MAINPVLILRMSVELLDIQHCFSAQVGAMRELLNMDDLEELLEECGDKIVVIDFWAGWCGPCKMMTPTFERLAKEPQLTANMEFVKVDVDEASDIAEWIGVECMPLFVFYKNGEKIDEMAGANPKMLEERVRKYATS